MNTLHKKLFVGLVVLFSPEVVCFAADPPVIDYNVDRFGAVADDDQIDTDAIQKAIDACSKGGGGRVLVPQGRYVTETLFLRDNIELHLDAEAKIVGVDNPDDYRGFPSGDWKKGRWNRGLIVGEGVKNVAITGQGVIDGNKVFDPKGEARMRGPHTILISDCQDFRIEGITIVDSANYAFLFYASRDITVRELTCKGGWDGIHFRGSIDRWNQRVRVYDCEFYTGDDCIAGHYIEDAVFENCTINSSCNGIRLIGPAKKLSFVGCDFFGPGKFEHRVPENLKRTNMLAAIMLQPSAWVATLGPVEDVLIKDATIRNVACALHVSTRPGNTAERLVFENISATDVYSSAISIESWTDQPIKDVTLKEIDVRYTPDAVIDRRINRPPSLQDPIRKPGIGVWGRKLPVWGVYARKVSGLNLVDVSLQTTDQSDRRPVIRLDSVTEYSSSNLTHSPLPQDAMVVEERK